jgi:signal peptidase II
MIGHSTSTRSASTTGTFIVDSASLSIVAGPSDQMHMKTSVRVAVIVLTISGCVGCDQLTKSIARDYLPDQTSISLLSDLIRLQRAENPGVFLSLGDALQSSTRLVLFTFGGALVVIGTALWALRSRRLSPSRILAAALISGGGLSNVIDRAIHGGNVTDFLNVGVGALRTGIFNFADMALMLGVAILILSDSGAGWLRLRG